jgi:DNA-binding transcriptional MerR regulator
MSKMRAKDKDNMVKVATIVEDTKDLGITAAAVRHYINEGLMKGTYKDSPVGKNSPRRFDRVKATKRLKEIKRLQKQRYPVKEIRDRLKDLI